MATAEGFEGFAILEIMGHRQVAGYVRDVALFGARMARIDVPEVPERKTKGYDYTAGRDVERVIPAIPAFTHYYGGASIFSMVPTTEELARAAAARFRSEPPQPLAPTSRQLEAVDDHAPDADLVEDEDQDRQCEGCLAPATRHDDDGVPLCEACFDELVADQGALRFDKKGAEVGGASAAADGSSGAPGSEPAPPTEAAP